MTQRKLDELRKKLRAVLEKDKERRKRGKVVVKPRYDEMYFRGVEWLNSL